MTDDLVPIFDGPPSWPRRQLREVLNERREYGRPELPLLSVSSRQGVRIRAGERDEGLRATGDLETYLVVHPGDLAVNKLVARSGAFGVSAHLGIVSPAYYCFAPRTEQVEPRYLDYALHSAPGIGEIWRSSKDLPPNSFDISREKFGKIAVPLPPLATQHRIANMLDAETARIDTLIEKNDRVLVLVTRRWQSLLERAIFGNAALRRAPLWLTCDITPGYAFRSDEFKTEGPVRLLRGINVGVGEIDWNDAVFGDWSTVTPAKDYQLVAGDLVVGMDRPWISAGLRVAQVRQEDEPAYLVQRVARLRPTSNLDRDYLYHALQSERFYAAFEPVMTGVSVPHVSGGQIGAFKVPLPDLQTQRRIVSDLNDARDRSQSLRYAIDRQQELLVLRRQSLITAAVTGQIEV